MVSMQMREYLSQAATEIANFHQTLTGLGLCPDSALAKDILSIHSEWMTLSRKVEDMFIEAECEMIMADVPAEFSVGQTGAKVQGFKWEPVNPEATTAVAFAEPAAATATATAGIRPNHYNLHVPPALVAELDTNVPDNRVGSGRNYTFIKAGNNGRTLILANAVTNPAEYKRVKKDRGRVRLSVKILARLLGVTKDSIRAASFVPTINGPHSLIIDAQF